MSQRGSAGLLQEAMCDHIQFFVNEVLKPQSELFRCHHLAGLR